MPVLGSASAGALADRGAWTASTAYSVSDVFTVNGLRRVVKAAYTSGSTYGTTDTTNSIQIGTAVDTTAAPTAGQVASFDASTGLFAPTSGVKLDAASSSYNLTPSSMDKWRKALARAQSGGAAAHTLFVGDSITYGSPGTTTAGQRFTEVFRQQLIAHGGVDHGTGLQNPESLALGTGAPLVVTSGTLKNINIGIVNGVQWINNGDVLTVTAVCDAFTIKYAKMVNGGVITTTLDGVASTSLDCSGAPANGQIVTTTITPASQGSHTLVLTGPTTNNGYLLGIEARKNTANGGVRVSTVGHGGMTTIQLNETAGAGFSNQANVSSIAALTEMAADLVVINLGVNDYTAAAAAGNVQVPLATYKANLQAAITAVRGAGGDVLLCGFTPMGDTRTITEASYIQQLYDLADANDVAVIDFQRRFVSRTVSSSMFTDAYHPNQVGHADMGNALYRALSRLGGI